MKSEDKTMYPGRIETQPYTMERTSARISHANEETEKRDETNVLNESEEGYAVESNDEYAGI